MHRSRTSRGRWRALAGPSLALVLLLSAGWPAAVAGARGAGTVSTLQSRVTQAQRRLQDVLGRRQSQESVVDRLRGQTQGFAVELGRVEEALFATISRMRQAEQDLTQVEAELQALELELAEKQAAVDTRSEVYTARLRALYKFTRTSPLEQLLASRDFSDALRRAAMMQAVTRVDNLLLTQLRVEQADLLRVRESLERKQAEAIVLRDEIDLQRQVLADRQAEQGATLQRAQQSQGQAEATLTQFDQQARAEQAAIVSLQAQYQRELEEMERRRQEELRRQEEQRRAQAAQAAQAATATARAAAATAQARSQATAQAAATATARAQVAPRLTATAMPPPRTTPAASGPSSRGDASSSRPGATPLPTSIAPRGSPVAVSGLVATGSLGPSADGFIWPVTNPVITTEFGERSPAQRYHTGIDLAQSLYTPVRAADGIVLESGLAVPGEPSQSYGMRVTIAHSRGFATLYAHLDDVRFKPAAKAGDRVQRGQLIGYIGMTGITTGPHLHFEILTAGEPKNPRLHLPK